MRVDGVVAAVDRWTGACLSPRFSSLQSLTGAPNITLVVTVIRGMCL